MYDQKLLRLAQDLIDSLTIRGIPVAQAFTASPGNDVYLTVTDTGPVKANAVIKLIREPQLANSLVNPVTGLSDQVFNPHRILIGFASAAKATGTIAFDGLVGGTQATGSVTCNVVVATNTVAINGVTFTAKGPGALAANEFHVGASDAETAANLANAIGASASAGVADIFAYQDIVVPEKVNLVVITPGVAGNAFGIVDGGAGTFTVSAATFLGGLDGDWFTINGSKFYALVVGSTVTGIRMFSVAGSDAAAALNAIVAINTNLPTIVSAALDPADVTNKTIKVTAVVGGVGGNYALTSSGVHAAVSGATMTGGSDTGTTNVTRYALLAEVLPKATQVEVFEKATAVAVADLVDANRVATFRDLNWGYLAHQ